MLGWVGTGPHTGGDCRPARPSLRGTGPRSWLSGSKAERTWTAPMDHTAAQVSGRCCHGAGVCGQARSGDRGVLQAQRVLVQVYALSVGHDGWRGAVGSV